MKINAFLSRFPRRTSWLACALGGAVLASLLRVLQRATAVEGPLDLVVPFAPATVALVCALAIIGAALLILAVTQPINKRPWAKGQAHRWDLVFLDRKDKLYPTLLIAAGFLALAAAPVLFVKGAGQLKLWLDLVGLSSRPSDNGLLALLTAAAALLAFFGLQQMARESFRPGQRGHGGFSASLPAVTGCLWLMEAFRAHASDPVLWDYAPQLLAITVGMLFYLDCAGMTTGAARPRRLLWLAGATIVLSALAAIGCREISDLLLLGTQTLTAAAALWRLPPNLEDPPVVGEPYEPMQEPLQEEESTHE